MSAHRLALALLACLASLPAHAAETGAACDLDYRLEARWNDTPRHFAVTLTYVAGAGVQRLVGPKDWASVNDYDKTVTDLRALSEGVTVAATTSNAWTVTGAQPKRLVKIRYKLLNGSPQVDGTREISQPDFYRNTLGQSHFQLIGHGAFVLPENLPDYASGTTCISFSGLPANWSFASSFSAGQQGGVATYRARGLSAQMQHALYLGGDYRVLERRVAGRPLFLALRGDWSFADEKFADTTATLIGAQRKFWNDEAFPHYLIALTPNRSRGSYGGTGLQSAFTMHASKDFSVPGRQYEYLVAHEHLHTWVPERLGAMGSDEAKRYWFSEGFTNYLTNRLLLRSGIWSPQQYAEAINRVVAAYRLSPVINIGNEQLAKEFFSRPEHSGQLAYQRGELLALTWANRLAARGKSLDALLQSLKLDRTARVERASNRSEDSAVHRLTDALRRELGDGVEGEIERLIERGETIAIDGGLLGPCYDARVEERAFFEIGLDVDAIFKSRKIAGVVPGSRAAQAGLRDGMTIRSFSYQNDATQPVTLAVLDEGVERKFSYLPASARTTPVPVFSMKDGARQIEGCQRWLAAAAS